MKRIPLLLSITLLLAPVTMVARDRIVRSKDTATIEEVNPTTAGKPKLKDEPTSDKPDDGGSEHVAHVVLPVCLNMLENFAEIILDPNNPEVVGPNVMHILADIAAIVEDLTKKDILFNLSPEAKEKLSKIINKKARLLAQRLKQLEKRGKKDTHATPEELDAKEREELVIILGNVLNVAGSFVNILGDPHNEDVVVQSVTMMLGSMVNIAAELMRDGKLTTTTTKDELLVQMVTLKTKLDREFSIRSSK